MTKKSDYTRAPHFYPRHVQILDLLSEGIIDSRTIGERLAIQPATAATYITVITEIAETITEKHMAREELGEWWKVNKAQYMKEREG